MKKAPRAATASQSARAGVESEQQTVAAPTEKRPRVLDAQAYFALGDALLEPDCRRLQAVLKTQEGRDVARWGVFGSQRHSALHDALHRELGAHISRLIPHSDPEARDEHGRTALHRLARLHSNTRGKWDEHMTALAKTCNLNAQTKEGETALMIAVNRLNHHLVDFLAQNKDTDLSLKQLGNDALMIAMMNLASKNDSLQFFEARLLIVKHLTVRQNERNQLTDEHQKLWWEITAAKGLAFVEQNGHIAAIMETRVLRAELAQMTREPSQINENLETPDSSFSRQKTKSL